MEVERRPQRATRDRDRAVCGDEYKKTVKERVQVQEHGEGGEDVFHALVECKAARRIWKLIDLDEEVKQLARQDMLSVIQDVALKRRKKDLEIFVAVCWAICFQSAQQADCFPLILESDSKEVVKLALTAYAVLVFCFSFHAILIPEILGVRASEVVGNETDRLALLEFKSKITHDPLGALGSWNESIHFCQWHGVTWVVALLVLIVVQNLDKLGNIERNKIRCFAIAPTKCMSLNLAVRYEWIVNGCERKGKTEEKEKAMNSEETNKADMEFLDEDTRPRFLFQSRPQPSSSSLDGSNHNNNIHQKPTKLSVFITLTISSFLIFVAFFFFQSSEPFQSLLLWLSLSLFIGPFAPCHLTGGHTRVGHGPIVETPPIPDPNIEKKLQKPQKNRSLANKSPDFIPGSVPIVENSNGSIGNESKGEKVEVLQRKSEEEKEWNEEDIEILKKQMVKNPVGKPKRWEVIAEAFNGRHRVESVIKKAKELGEKKIDDSDSYNQFLKNRKAIDMRVVQENCEDSKKESQENVVVGGGGGVWNAGEDIALLNALKAFPKDVPLRWEKIAAAVPGRSKAACMKRFSDLKRDFRSSKAGDEA
ncbi:transcription factor MAMYB [Citrus sinensis]|uniref:Transcription factor MAMYB n=1 Tax=Citrus sinensis TaxID=2711 RepID=A0ACB8L925_CITSI|nr:transcription factor MAMYB [Citrus sinensis]